MQALRLLDRRQAINMGLARSEDTPRNTVRIQPLSIREGREAYEKHLKRPAASGGVRRSTYKRYRTVFNKFEFSYKLHKLLSWDVVDDQFLENYVADLEERGYKRKTIRNEVTTLKQLVRFLIEKSLQAGREPLKLQIKQAESQSAYCWKPEEVAAMVALAAEKPELAWLHNVIVVLANTGLRISELASLRWTDVDLVNKRLTLTDEAGQSKGPSGRTLKSGKSRSLTIHSDLEKLLKSLDRKGPFVLYGPRGGRRKPDTVGRRLKKDLVVPLSVRFSGTSSDCFSRGTCHSFRHYFISTCATSGVPIMVLMDWVGHADSAMVRKYFRLHDQESKRQMERVSFVPTVGGVRRREET